MQEGRWTTITPSQFAHEREALAHVQALLPDTEPYRAWSNFTFTAQTGHPYEVDLLVAAPGGLYLIEIKSLNGRLISSGSNWILHGPRAAPAPSTTRCTWRTRRPRSSSRCSRSPPPGARARRSGSRSCRRRCSCRSPGCRSSSPTTTCTASTAPSRRPATSRASCRRSARCCSARRRTSASGSPRRCPRRCRTCSKEVGIARSRRHYQVGAWELETRPFDVGPTWQDHLARHRDLERERRRVRIYLVERNAVQAERASIERAAKREMLVLHGINHPGIVQVDSMESHEAGPALIFRYDPRSMRLDHYMAQYGDRLDALSRLAMIRQLAETVAYAHRRRLHHRALSARSVLVSPGRQRRGGSEDEAWLTPAAADQRLAGGDPRRRRERRGQQRRPGHPLHARGLAHRALRRGVPRAGADRAEAGRGRDGRLRPRRVDAT